MLNTLSDACHDNDTEIIRRISTKWLLIQFWPEITEQIIEAHFRSVFIAVWL